MSDLTAVVLAGGEGKRFWPLSTNKLLFPIAGKPLIQYSVLSSLPKDTSKIVIVTSPTNDAFIRSLSFPVPVSYVVQPDAKGMADALRCAKPYIDTKRIFIMIGDDLCDENLGNEVIKTAEGSDAFGVIPGLKVDKYFPGGYLQLEGKRIQTIIEKPSPEQVPSSMVNISGHFIADQTLLFAALDHTVSTTDDQYEQALSLLMKEKEFVVHEYEGSFLSLKYPWHVLDIMNTVLDKLVPLKGEHCEIKQNVIIEGPVYIGNNVRIFENTKIVGPVYIGDNTIVGNNNVIRHSYLGANCVTGFNTDITRSYIGDSCWFHSNYIGDSVLEGNISMGSGSVLANLRLDEGDISSSVKSTKVSAQRNKLGAIIGHNVRIGVNTSIMPGIKIGKNSLIGAGITVAKDIPDNSFVYGKQEVFVEQNTKEVGSDREQFKNKL